MSGEGLELERVKGVLATSHVLHSVFAPTALAAHTVQGLGEDLRCHAVLVLQDEALLQRHRHGRAVLGALAAGEAHAV